MLLTGVVLGIIPKGHTVSLNDSLEKLCVGHYSLEGVRSQNREKLKGRRDQAEA